MSEQEMLERWEMYREEMRSSETRLKRLAMTFLGIGDYESASRCAIKAEGLRFIQGRMPPPRAAAAIGSGKEGSDV